MESLLAACLGWIATQDELIDIRSGMRVRNISDDRGTRAEIVYPNGDIEEFEGNDADAIFDRAEWLSNAAANLISKFDAAAAQVTNTGA